MTTHCSRCQSRKLMASLKHWTQRRYCHNKEEEVLGCAERIPRSLSVTEDERAPPNQITLSAQTASLFVRRLSDVGCWDVTPLIESHNKDLVWTAPSIVHGGCNHPNNLAPWNIKWRHGSCRNLHRSLWSGGKFKQSRLSLCKQCEGDTALPFACPPAAAAAGSPTSAAGIVLATEATERHKSCN